MSFFSSTWINGASMPQVVLRAGDTPPSPRQYAVLDSTKLSASVSLPTPTTVKSLSNSFLGAVSNMLLSGKVYFEYTMTSGITNDNVMMGVVDTILDPSVYQLTVFPTHYAAVGGIWFGGNMNQQVSGVPQVGDTIAVIVDCDAKLMWCSLNGVVASGDPVSGVGGYPIPLSSPYYACICTYYTGEEIEINFGATPFVNSPPSGYDGVFQELRTYSDEYSTAYS